MKVLLVNLPNRYGNVSRAEAFFPIGLGYIAGALLKQGHDVKLLDINLLNLSDANVIETISAEQFDVFGISAMSTQFNYVKWLSSEIRKAHPNAKIILGWVLATYSAEIVLNNTDIDICVIGEGDITIQELLVNLHDINKVNGVIYKVGDNIVSTQPRKYVDNLDDLPSIPYELFPIESYIDNLSLISLTKAQKTINISCGRGCPYSCTFCSKSFSGVRLRSIDNVIKEIKHLQLKYGVKRIFFTDELLVINKKRITELCEKIAPLHLNWSCQGRINLVDKQMLIMMKDAGCTAIGYGVESGSQKILDAMKKQITVERSFEVLKMTKKIGLTPLIQVIFGYPGENMQTIHETIKFFKNIDVPFVQFTPITPLPGTPLWKQCVENKSIVDEYEFMKKLEGGYNPDAELLVNLTKFTNSELLRLRKWSERTIRLSYLKRHPIYSIKLIKSKISELGLRGLFNTIYSYYS